MSFIHPDAIVIGDVVLGPQSSVWPAAVLRADTDRITIGAQSNIQDGAVLHADPGAPCVVGDRVTIGHRAIVHGATVEAESLVGMGAVVLNGAVVGRGSVVAAGAVILEGAQIPPGSLVAGVPARVIRPVDDETRDRVSRGVDVYVELQARHARGEFRRHRG